MSPDPDLVAGEPRAVLREAFAGLRTTRRPDGTLDVDGEVGPELAEPLVRALGRVGDELTADDDRRGVPVRTGGRLAADAFVALLLRVTDPER